VDAAPVESTDEPIEAVADEKPQVEDTAVEATPESAKPEEDAVGDELDDLFGGIEIDITPVSVPLPRETESAPVENTEDKGVEASAEPAPATPSSHPTESVVEEKTETASPTPATPHTPPESSEVEAPVSKSESAEVEDAESKEESAEDADADGSGVTAEPKKRGIGILPTKVKDNKSKKTKSKRKPGPQKNKALFWVLLCIAIPIIVMLAATVVMLYVAFWVILALLMIFSIAALIAIVAVGALVSLVGIVYGVVQIVTGEVPVGLFEIGLGVIIGAAVMMVSILVYNFAVRLIPFAMKKLTSLLPIIFKKGMAGYEVLKGVIENI
jgi:hypothetical protein